MSRFLLRILATLEGHKGHFLSSAKKTPQKKTSYTADLFFLVAWQCPTLTGGDPQLPSALKSLTSVFGMGTGVASSPSLPDNKGTLFLQN